MKVKIYRVAKLNIKIDLSIRQQGSDMKSRLWRGKQMKT